MREIKFRAWDGVLDEMNTWDKIYRVFGCLLHDRNYNIMQFTGLKDVNNKEIYEGDVVMTKVDKGIVYWHQPMCSFTNTFGGECVVIGNIYENPELAGV